MSTVQQLINDLSNLASESKRRNSEIRHACDKAITDLKSYQPKKRSMIFHRTKSKWIY